MPRFAFPLRTHCDLTVIFSPQCAPCMALSQIITRRMMMSWKLSKLCDHVCAFCLCLIRRVGRPQDGKGWTVVQPCTKLIEACARLDWYHTLSWTSKLRSFDNVRAISYGTCSSSSLVLNISSNHSIYHSIYHSNIASTNIPILGSFVYLTRHPFHVLTWRGKRGKEGR